tara:strand:- start:2 stop:169 length:168 start_codon:yes stop_codon:yes gene_type:complete
LLNWFSSEKLKDQKELSKEKEKIVKQIKGLKKEDLFPKPIKLSLWKRIKIILLGK